MEPRERDGFPSTLEICRKNVKFFLISDEMKFAACRGQGDDEIPKMDSK